MTHSRPTAESAPGNDNYRWLVSVWVVVAAFGAVTLIRSHQVGIGIRDPGGTIFLLRVVLSLVWFGALILIDASFRVGRHGWTVRKARIELRRRWPKDRLALGLSGLLAYHLVYLSYHNLKSWNALRPIHDGRMLQIDSWLFLGHSPAVLLHDALGQHLATYVLAIVYESFSYLVPMSFVAALVFANRIRDGYVFLTASMWTWILGTASYYLIPTIGPFHSAPRDFSGLPHTWITAAQSSYLADRIYFQQHPGASDAFNSIGAFASLHVGVTCMTLLMIRYYGFRRATRAMTIYLAAVVISTIYLGWHFVLDDAAGVVLAVLAVLFARLTVYPRGRHRQWVTSDTAAG